MIERRAFIKILALSLLPIPTLEPGPTQKLWACLAYNDKDVTERTAVDFQWNTEADFDVDIDQMVKIDGMVLYKEQHDVVPFRSHRFSGCANVFCLLPGDAMHVRWKLVD